MKTTLTICLLTGALMSRAHAQGTVNFSNRIPGLVDARVQVVDANGILTPADANYVAQLYASAPGGNLFPVGNPIPFRDSSEAAKGYWIGDQRMIPGVAENGQAQVQVRAWDQRLGVTYEAVATSSWGYGYGVSGTITVTTGGGLTPPQPMMGLQGFTIQGYILPEPASLSLVVVGGLLLGCGPRVRRSST